MKCNLKIIWKHKNGTSMKNRETMEYSEWSTCSFSFRKIVKYDGAVCSHWNLWLKIYNNLPIFKCLCLHTKATHLRQTGKYIFQDLPMITISALIVIYIFQQLKYKKKYNLFKSHHINT
jgi:hypothetical protein